MKSNICKGINKNEEMGRHDLNAEMDDKYSSFKVQVKVTETV
jgi:hypothetical protein